MKEIDKERNLLTKEGFHRRVLDYMAEGFTQPKAFEFVSDEFNEKHGVVNCKNYASFKCYQVSMSHYYNKKKIN